MQGDVCGCVLHISAQRPTSFKKQHCLESRSDHRGGGESRWWYLFTVHSFALQLSWKHLTIKWRHVGPQRRVLTMLASWPEPPSP